VNKTYRIGQFARRASVSVRTLRYYDQLGLLSPSHVSESGYRLYSDEDYPRLQQILGLRYLGFSLEEIRRCLAHGPQRFKEMLAIQKAMLQQRKEHLEMILQTIQETEAQINDGPPSWEPILQIIEVIQMKEKNEWIRQYFDETQMQQLSELSAAAYSAEDHHKLAEWGKDWSEADQREADRKWSELFAEVKRLADAGSDPAGAEAQALAGRWRALIGEFTRGDPGVSAGLQKFWQQVSALPPEQSPFPKAFTPQQEAFLNQMLAASGC